MSDIAEKILARLDEIERLAHAAATDSRDTHWSAGGEWSETVTTAETGSYILCAPYDGALGDDLRRFLVAHDPASVLRRCAADREMVEIYKGALVAVEVSKGTILADATKVRLGAYQKMIDQLARGYGLEVEA